LGVLIARQLKLKDYAFKISVVLFAALLGLMPFLYQGVLGVYEQQNYENRLAEWEAAGQESPLKAEDIVEIENERRDLSIDSPSTEDTPPKISTTDE
ncbi:MAG: hypothetical protein KDA84_13315, partial [Planctomycetaceae bacterium]|nr:hypothetical protein [Planctomycetaceae bacterium]